MFLNKVKDIRGDIFGGITAGIVALPMGLAFGIASGLGPLAGLYGAILVCFFASIFGGTATQISGPTGPMTVVVASIVATHPNQAGLVFMSIFLAGIIQILFGVLKTGKYVKYVPYPVISGFMSGIGVIIILLQINPFVGLPSMGTTIDSIQKFFTSFDMMNVQCLLIGTLTLLILFLTPKKISKKIPPILIALISITALTYVLQLDVPKIGEIQRALPQFQLTAFDFKDFQIMLPIALTLACLGSIDSLLTSIVADSLTKTKHNSNKELIGQGLGNMAAAMFGGIAGAGATMRTVVNIKSGGNTRLSGVIHSLILVMILICLAPLASQIPLAVLAAILIKVGFDIIDYKFIKVIKIAPKEDLIVMLIVFLITVFDDLIFAVGVGIVLASILFAINISKQINVDVDEIEECSVENGEKICDRNITVITIDGIFFFGSASQVISRIENYLEKECIILDCSRITAMDISAVFALEEIIIRLKDKKIRTILVLHDKEITLKLFKLGLLKLIGRNDITYNKKKALEKIQKCNHKNNGE